MGVTLTRVTQTYDAATDATTSATTTITGSAVRVRPRSIFEWEQYKALSLIESDAPTLLFTPDTYGDEPKVGDTVVWPETGGETYTVKAVNPIAPDGVLIAARIVVAK